MVVVNLLKMFGWCVLLFIIVKAGPALAGVLAVCAMMGIVWFFVRKE